MSNVTIYIFDHLSQQRGQLGRSTFDVRDPIRVQMAQTWPLQHRVVEPRSHAHIRNRLRNPWQRLKTYGSGCVQFKQNPRRQCTSSTVRNFADDEGDQDDWSKGFMSSCHAAFNSYVYVNRVNKFRDAVARGKLDFFTSLISVISHI